MGAILVWHTSRSLQLQCFGMQQQESIIEWVDSSNNTVDQLTFDALIALGFRVRVFAYGASISADNYKLVATPWPRQAPRREEDPTLYRLDKPDAGTGIATAGSEAGAGVRVVSAQGAVPTAGGTLVRVGERPMGTFPESKPYPPSF